MCPCSMCACCSRAPSDDDDVDDDAMAAVKGDSSAQTSAAAILEEKRINKALLHLQCDRMWVGLRNCLGRWYDVQIHFKEVA